MNIVMDASHDQMERSSHNPSRLHESTGSRAEGRWESEQGVLQMAKRAAGCKYGASMTRLPDNDESSKYNPINEEE